MAGPGWEPHTRVSACSELRLPRSFSGQILDEVEKRHQISMAVIYPFMQGLREAAFPAPGKTVTLKSFIPDSGTEVSQQDGGDPPRPEGAPVFYSLA